ncbi:Pumilio RNA-binding region-containing protein [Dictyostelium discoideum AX4]|uniref:Pumilio RNA-binding region-containing protein n=1 Tax=Dictyostelium discoideum TaxID=44689 RepID=Q54IS5_DICDI|nr:Pumilio RNA-binding region-containing protein [Dictyostelium discoideum AX4]EAL63168.1 Pumilio RNA-binding region-containing protein [Dictyostelium discoideum AX4]|eukprot:XP_636672.1 Pumilio RNA-binding region-containing protein [Dictyostelium discoideum AX4]
MAPAKAAKAATKSKSTQNKVVKKSIGDSKKPVSTNKGVGKDNIKVKEFKSDKKPLNNKYNDKKNTTTTTTTDKENESNKSNEPKKKLTKKEKREEKFEKKSKFDKNHSLVRDLKILWVKIKEIKLSSEERATLIEQLTQKLKGNVLNVIVKHDASRVVQTLLKYGNEAQREIVFKELKDQELTISKTQYGRFLILKLLKYGTEEQRNTIIKQFYGKFVSMISHKESSSVVEYIFSEIASKLQKTHIIEEFYGPEYRLFKTEQPRTLDSIVESSPQKKEPIITYLSSQLTKILSSKGERLVQFTIIQTLLIEFFKHASPDNCVDMSETLGELLLPMIHSKEGSQVAYYVISYATPKTRKSIVKSLKDFIPKIASEEYGFLALVRLLDVTDDTQMIIKSVFNELIPVLPECSITKQGSLWILHLLAPYSAQNFTEQTLSLLTKSMVNSCGIQHEISKKDRDQRRKELLNWISPKLIELCSNHTQDLLSSQWGTKVLNQTLKNADGNKIILMKRILDLLEQEEFLEEQHINIQSLLRNDHIKSTDLPQQLIEKHNWIDLCTKNQNIVYIYRDLLKSLPNDLKDKETIQLKKSKSKLEATKFKGIENLFNLKDDLELQQQNDEKKPVEDKKKPAAAATTVTKKVTEEPTTTTTTITTSKKVTKTTTTPAAVTSTTIKKSTIKK